MAGTGFRRGVMSAWLGVACLCGAWMACSDDGVGDTDDGGPGSNSEAGPDGDTNDDPDGDADGSDGIIRSSLERDTSPDVSISIQDAIVQGNNAFGMDLYRQIRGEEDNIFCSPYSISAALAMTYAGARGETESQMAETLHFTVPQADLHPGFNWLDLELESRRGDEGDDDDNGRFRLSIANALWGQVDYPFESDFLDVLATSYDAGIHVADFEADPEGARDRVNQWVNERTMGRIPEVVPPNGITIYTRWVLANAIYFTAAWATQFDELSTRIEPFNLLDGSSEDVSMMHNHEYFRYAEDTGYQALSMPYEGYQLAMTVLLPEEGGFESFEESLDADRMATILETVNSSPHVPVSLSMPKFTFETPFALKEVFQAMGMTVPFERDEADFSGISARALRITDIFHRAFVAVDENGTEAAAATVVVGDGDGDGDGDPDFVTFRADRPFVFLIQDVPTGEILFLGRVVDPV